VDLNDSLGRFLPQATAGKQAITTRQLLSHTSGMGEVDVEGLTDRDAAVSKILSAPLDHAVGEFR
jgi:CubicO group peptidase (beta-lactamase class C family)